MINNFYQRVVLSLMYVVFSTFYLYAKPNYPAKAYGQPVCFAQSYTESYNWEDIAKSRRFGTKSSNSWTVYACEEDIVAYENPSTNSAVCVSDIHFMEDFYVADIQGDYALLFYYDSRLNGLDIPEEITRKKSSFSHRRRTNGYVGWVEIDKLLLWTIAPRTEEGIFKKIAIVKNVNATVDFNSMPEMFDNEACINTTGEHQYVNALDFYFMLKKSDNDNALVYQNYQLDGRMVGSKVGWIKSGEYIDWNTRICWEPAFGVSGINDKAYTFATEKDARNKNMNSIVSTAHLSETRYSTQYEPRSPVVNYNPNTSTAYLSVIANKQKGANNAGDIMRLIHQMEKSLSTINIVFVMDATNSMKSCFVAMSNAVKQIANYNYASSEKSTVKFGAVVYRNYKDAPKGLVEMAKLVDNSNNYSEICNFLDTVRCFSASPYPQEAMFYGLNYAIDNMDWGDDGLSNFIILISDVTSKDPDERGFTAKNIAKKLAQKGINLVAFQARSQKDTEYQNFGSQVCNIIEEELQHLGYPLNVEYDQRLQIYYYNRDYTGKWPMQPMGYKKKLSSEQNINATELTNMATSIIKEFIVITQDNINEFLKGIGGTQVDQSVCDALIERGKIRTCDDLKGMIRLSGYAQPTWSVGKRMFTPCVFLAEKEFDLLIKELQNATVNSSEDRRGLLQKVLKKLILSYTGQKLTESSFDYDLSGIMESIEYECGCEFHSKVKKHIENPNKLTDTEIKQLVTQLDKAIAHLLKLQNDANTYKEQNGKKYYYILLKDMPFVLMR